MRITKLLFALLVCFQGISQNSGSIVGKIIDKEFNDEPLAFANVLIKGTTKGTTSDFDGLYEFQDLDPGQYTLVFSFVGYETQEIQASVEAEKVTTINVTMGANPGALDEVVITTTARKDSEIALLLDQKKAVEIKESIGSAQLATLGVSNASAATAKISGVSKSDGSGQIYIRGLGDRYLTTTLNGLPIPSDNIDKKNIDLALFPSRFVQNIGISKTFSPKNSADQASGNIDIVSREVTKKSEIGLSLGGGVNSNAMSQYDNFKVTANHDDISLGIYSRGYSSDNLENAITNQSWNTQFIDTPIDRSFAFNVGGIVDEDRKLRMMFSGGQSVNHEYNEGVFREFDQGLLRDNVPDDDNVRWLREINSVAMFNTEFRLNDRNKFSLNSFLINKIQEETFEAGRKRTSIFFEELDPPERANQFVRDQNIKNTLLSITQLIGSHDISENNRLEWAAGFNWVSADEPNRIRNEVNILNDIPGTPQNEDGIIQFGFTGGFQQRKQYQEITDTEYNARIQDEITLKKDEDENAIYKIAFGGNFRNKSRNFESQFIGADETTTGSVNPPSIDDLSQVFTQDNFDNGTFLLNVQPEDSYKGDLTSYAGYADFVGVFGKLTAEVGLRFQSDEIDVNFDVGNFVNRETGQPRIGQSLQNYERIYPAVNLKYDVNDKFGIRLAGSLSQTLPEFKEIAPFQYVSPQGQVTQGNPDIEASRNLNLDLKFEFFPTNEELLSLTAFYKTIQDPINRTLLRGAAGAVFTFNNSGEEARIYGLELEGRVFIIPKQDNKPNLRLAGNVSYMDHIQDLKTLKDNDGNLIQEFKYGGKDETGLEGASDWITNLALTANTGDKYPYEITLSGNYSSDRIYSLGAPRVQNQPDTFFNGEITERGVVFLDFILNKDIDDHWSFSASATNLLNPIIRRTQFVDSPVTEGISDDITVLSYRRGVNASLGISYEF